MIPPLPRLFGFNPLDTQKTNQKLKQGHSHGRQRTDKFKFKSNSAPSFPPSLPSALVSSSTLTPPISSEFRCASSHSLVSHPVSFQTEFQLKPPLNQFSNKMMSYIIITEYNIHEQNQLLTAILTFEYTR